MDEGVSMTVLSVTEAAKFLGKPVASLRNMYKQWGVPHFYIGSQIKFSKEALIEWLEKGGSPTKPSRKEKKTA